MSHSLSYWNFENWNDMKHKVKKFWSAETFFKIYAKLIPYMISNGESQTPLPRFFSAGRGRLWTGHFLLTPLLTLSLIFASENQILRTESRSRRIDQSQCIFLLILNDCFFFTSPCDSNKLLYHLRSYARESLVKTDHDTYDTKIQSLCLHVPWQTIDNQGNPTIVNYVFFVFLVCW